MEISFCDSNTSPNPNSLGGLLFNSTVNDAAWQHLTQVVNSWDEAFDSPLVSQQAYTKFFDFDKSIVLELLSQANCVALRIFPGFDENGKITACLVGVIGTKDDKEELITGSNIKLCCCPSNGESSLFT